MPLSLVRIVRCIFVLVPVTLFSESLLINNGIKSEKKCRHLRYFFTIFDFSPTILDISPLSWISLCHRGISSAILILLASSLICKASQKIMANLKKTCLHLGYFSAHLAGFFSESFSVIFVSLKTSLICKVPDRWQWIQYLTSQVTLRYALLRRRRAFYTEISPVQERFEHW